MNMDQAKLHNAIALLSQLPKTRENDNDYLRRMDQNVYNVLRLFPNNKELQSKINHISKVTIRFVFTSLYVLKQLSTLSNDDSPSNLISIQQQQKIKILLQMIFSVGLTPSLIRGVDIPLRNKTAQLYLLILEELTLIESYTMMSEVVRSLVKIMSVPNFRSLILTHLGDLIAALLQLIHTGEFKKPVKNSNSDNKKSSSENSSIGSGGGSSFVMTEEWYQKLVKDRNEFKVIYKELIDNIYKPLVIRELLILLSPMRYIEDGETATPPPWLRKAISCQLTGYLTSPGGVSLIMRAMCDSSTDVIDWKKVEGIAKLISTEHGNLSEDEYYLTISPQVISMLNTTGPYCIPVAKTCIRNIYQHNPAICDKYIFEKLFEPFIICSKPIAENFNGTLVSEDALARCIDHLGKCFAVGSKESSLPMSALKKIIKIIYQLYIKVHSSPYHLKKVIQDLLIEFFYAETDVKNLTYIYNSIIFNEPHEDILEMNPDLEFHFGSSAGVLVRKRSLNEPAKFQPSKYEIEIEIAGDCLLDILSYRTEYSKKLLSDLFSILLSTLSTFHESKIEIPDSNPCLLSAEELVLLFVEYSQRRVITVKLLALLAENIHVVEKIQENPDLVFQCLENLLELKAKDLLRNKDEANEKSVPVDEYEYGPDEDTDDLFIVLSVVDLMTINVKSNSVRWDKCKSLLRPIEVIKDTSEDEFIRYFSDLLHKRILTRGAVSGSKKPQSKYINNEKFLSTNPASLKNEMGNSNNNNNNNNNTNNNNNNNNNNQNNNNKENHNNEKKEKVENKTKSPNEKSGKKKKTDKETKDLDAVLDDLSDLDVPTRGHAIIQLGKLIRKGSPEVLAKKDFIYTSLRSNLNHQDTYIYLAVINALESLARVVNPDKILETLCKEYTYAKKEFSEVQMKIGEVLMRITRGLGDIAPKYKSLLVNTFLFGAKSSDELLRVSSLSNLGELLKILGYSVTSILQEVLICMKSIALTDKSEMARRAALMVAHLLLKGVSENAFMVLEPIICDLYRALLHVYKTDKDEGTRLHAELALTQINRLVKCSFNQTLKLEKHIGILSLTQYEIPKRKKH